MRELIADLVAVRARFPGAAAVLLGRRGRVDQRRGGVVGRARPHLNVVIRIMIFAHFISDL